MKNNFKELRNRSGMSLYDIANKSGVAYSVLYYLENNERDIRLSTAAKIAKVLNCTVTDLIKETYPWKNNQS